MEEIYFPAFKTVIQKAGARSLMTAYNSFDGSPCTANDWLLNKKLRNEWGFRGFTISDACAVGGANVLHMTASDYSDAGKIAVENGLDVIFQTDFNHINLFKEPFENGTVNRNIIDSAVTRVLRAKFQLGLFEDPYTGEEAANKVNGSPEHRELAIQAARESIVLLKNEDNVLPVSAGVKTIAIIGTDAVEARLGGYSGQGNQKISILSGMKQSAPKGVEILYSPGCGRVDKPYQVIPSENFLSQNDVVANGLKAEYFDNITLDGFPKLTRLDPAVNFDWTLYGPDPSIPFDWYSVRWTGKLKSSSTGTYKIGVEGNDGYRLYLGGKLLIDNWNKRSYSTTMTGFDFNKGQSYDLKLEYFESTGNARLKLVWTAGTTDTISLAIQRAVEISKKADLVICVVGIEEGEFRDRASLALPGRQEEMISALAETGKPLVVVLVGGSAVTMNPWIDRVKAIVDVWYPGEAGGTAVADVLYGNYNPAGRLPITFPISEGQLPLVYNHKPTGRGDDYHDLTGMALFPFGFGLSYTTFRYSDLEFSQDTIDASDSVMVRFKIQNTGKTIGDEVWQLYIRDEISSVAKPVTELKGFGRVSLLPGQVKSVEMIIPSESLATLGKDLRPMVEPGIFRIMVGASSKDIRLRGKIYCRE
jgi:beta-glucosidase